MATKKFLDEVGTGYLWGKIKDALDDKAAASRVTALEEKHASGKTVAQEVSDGIAALSLASTYATKSVVDTLVGTDTGKSVRGIAAEEIAAQLIADNPNADLDTLQEIAAWIQAHPGDASTMNAAITALQNKTLLGNQTTVTYVAATGTFEAGTKYYTDNTGATEVDTTSFVAGETDVSSYFVAQTSSAQYATVKAYVEAMMAEVQAASHSHSNKSTLDAITGTKTSNWDAAYADKHTHANKSTLDGIAAEDITAWNGAATNSHTHSNALVLDAIDATKVAAWDAAAADTYTAITTTEIDNIINPPSGGGE